MSKIIVTGGSGFIGTNLIEYFISSGNSVINIDVVKPKIADRRDIWKNVDILDRNQLMQIFVDFCPDYLVHLAARTDLNGKTIQDYRSNTDGVKNILECCAKTQSLRKVIITSSMLVCKVGYQPKNQFDFAPSTIYGESKIITEKLVWENQPKCDWAIIRPTSIWGPWFGEPYRNFFDRVIAKTYFHIGNKSCTKTYGFVGNAVYEIGQILFKQTEDIDNKVFYIGDYAPTNIEEWANEIADQLGYKILKVPYIAIWGAAKLGDLLKRMGINFPMTSFRLKNMTTNHIVDLANTNDIVGELKWSREKGIQKTLEWMIKNEKN